MVSILIVEDEPDLLEEFAFLVEAMGYDVFSAANGIEAIHLAKTHQPDLMLCDILMPEMDGYAVLQEVRQDPSIARTPFIFLTARAEQEAYRQGMEFGADDYLTKPCTREQLERAIRTQLAKAHKNEQIITRAVLTKMNEKQAAERAFISEQMDNYVGSILRSIGLATQSLQDVRMDASYKRRLQQIKKLVDEAVDELHAIALELHPVMLDHLGLQAAISWLVERFNQHHTETRINLTLKSDPDAAIPDYLQREIYQLIQTWLRQVDKAQSTHYHDISLAAKGDMLVVDASIRPPLPFDEATWANVQQQLQIHDGMIEANTQNYTQTLRITYPLAINATVTSPPEPSPFANVQQLPLARVFIYSSNATAGLSLRTMLRRQPQLHILDVVTQPSSLRDCLRHNKADLLLLDVDYDGGQVLSLAKQNGIPVLLLADRASQAIVPLLRQGAAGFIVKRALVSELPAAIHTILNDQVYLSSPLREAAFESFISGHTPDRNSAAQLAALTRREVEILQWVVGGYTSVEIAHELSISPRTVETHRSNMLKKLDVKSKAALIRLAINAGIDMPPNIAN